ncbi:Mpv17 / PMP22 family [Seminavis robusta]|uniref:Mpv17 / PMP22 family n=1 Tax=Seminavis robusta TaxID=568900 RepID=A0A9N8DH63_9STRA|nr:Mpv17 / PMP22 family [Seminavis robusta]|eukprot:Sro88_g046740.1 Mpv17 / PMP22 family (424) ;mRNA; r:117700-119179
MLSTVLTKAPLWARLKSVPSEHPFAFGVVISGIKTSCSDLLVQKVIERKEQVDWKRNAAFAAFGFVYLGGVQYAIYVPFFGRLFPRTAAFVAKPFREKVKDTRGILGTAAQVFLDQAVHHPLMYFPAFYATKELVMKEKPDVGRAMSEYRQNMKEDLLALWKVWVPATFVNFFFAPMHLRIVGVAATSLVWTCILSVMRGGDVQHAEDMIGGAVTGASFTLLKEGLDERYNTSPVELDPDQGHLCISAAGKQRPGLVALLARHVASQGGNVTHSKMVRLGEEFIIQMHVAVPQDKQVDLLTSLESNPTLHEFNIQATKLNVRCYKKQAKAVIGMQIHCVGRDRPGMLAAVAERIAGKDMSIESVETQLRMHGDQREFVVDALVSSNNESDKENLTDLLNDLSKIKEELGLDTLDIRVQGCVKD